MTSHERVDPAHLKTIGLPSGGTNFHVSRFRRVGAPTRMHQPPLVTLALAPLLLVAGCQGSANVLFTNLDGSAPNTAANGSGTGDAKAPVDAEATVDAEPAFDGDVDAAACQIIASNYDQSCTVDSDCVSSVGTFPHAFSVFFGNYCESQCACAADAINQTAAGKYLNDVLGTPLGSGAIPFQDCSCGSLGPACCVSGRCTLSYQCSAEVSASDGGDDASAQASPLDSGVLCSATSGPLDSGVAQPGVAQFCAGTCSQVASGWACCIFAGAGTYLCSTP